MFISIGRPLPDQYKWPFQPTQFTIASSTLLNMCTLDLIFFAHRAILLCGEHHGKHLYCLFECYF